MNNQKENLKIVVLGLGLIVIIGSITFIRPLLNKQADEEKTTESVSLNLEKIKLISPESLFQKQNQQQSLFIFDLRSKAEFDLEHILNSQNWTEAQILNSKDNFSDSQQYIILDDGITTQGKKIIAQLDYPENFFYLDGGFYAWKKSAYPTISMGNPSSFIDQSKVTFIDIDIFKTTAENKNSFFILDIRSSEDFKKEHLKNSHNIPLDELEKRSDEILSSSVVFVYGSSRLEAFQAGVRLSDLSFFNIKVFNDSYDKLKEKGLEIET